MNVVQPDDVVVAELVFQCGHELLHVGVFDPRVHPRLVGGLTTNRNVELAGVEVVVEVDPVGEGRPGHLPVEEGDGQAVVELAVVQLEYCFAFADDVPDEPEKMERRIHIDVVDVTAARGRVRKRRC